VDEQGAPRDAETPAAEDPALSALIYGWGDAYEIRRDEEGWHARRRDGLGRVMTEDQLARVLLYEATNL